MPQHGLHSCLTATPNNGEALAAILLRAAELLKTQEGCQLYMVSLGMENKDEVWITECWTSEKHHADSLTREDVRALIGEAMPLLSGPPTSSMKLEVLGGLGV